ncbi:uncharacterized protein LOC131223428 [Magnolia sinica]|uniref:uncharacterized protein LOC131223428 n=1 Tax=Magnolia sinica TaxID=86752 RepID=UPI00265957B5|nr:uncharacterized protein LOC131223428 [Magnolia sinica]
MAKKRKSAATRLDEVDRTMYTTFCSAANSLSQLYTQAMNQQKLAFQAGERHAMEKLYQWILRQHEEGSRVMGADIVAYLQNELDYGGEDPSMSPRLQHQHQHHQTAMHSINSSLQATSGSFGQAATGQGLRSGHSDQTKNSVFSNALSSPVRRSLQPFHFAQGGYYPNNVLQPGNGAARNQEMNFPHPNRESNSLSSNDSSMDMHADSPNQEPY